MPQLPQSAAYKQIHRRGALEFWDVYPQPAGDRLHVDIMNPHFRDYHTKGNVPTDNSELKPIFFLALPVESQFTFHVRLRPCGPLPSAIRENWRSLLEAAFERAFEWLGFGAKTAAGYGRLRTDPGAARRREEAKRQAREAEAREREEARRQTEEQARRQQLESLSPLDAS